MRTNIEIASFQEFHYMIVSRYRTLRAYSSSGAQLMKLNDIGISHTNTKKKIGYVQDKKEVRKVLPSFTRV